MTCGELDHSVRLWDFESERLILHKQYTEDICGIALHPTGLFCLIGFSDKLCFTHTNRRFITYGGIFYKM